MLLPQYLNMASVLALLPRCHVCICSASLVSFKFCSYVSNRCCHFLFSSSMVPQSRLKDLFKAEAQQYWDSQVICEEVTTLVATPPKPAFDGFDSFPADKVINGNIKETPVALR